MNKNQVEGHANEAKGKAVAGGKSSEHKDKDEKHGGKDGAVLADINDDAKKLGSKDGAESGDINADVEKHGGKDGAVLAGINDDAKKKTK
ncbi:hypothetical protein [Halomonas sp. M4R1S46]|uniref:hypothetical protein n=1 Tax=Halomonas sp. M4R1S46 TaxID=2982692 RepID=UPI0021E4555D|nr:hypothetical protein [Halomonas sp. M4R1S46]UYG08416.1 hypothetical protein OCT48_03480 [Halomonas sp. M4R1S46]